MSHGCGYLMKWESSLTQEFLPNQRQLARLGVLPVFILERRNTDFTDLTETLAVGTEG